MGTKGEDDKDPITQEEKQDLVILGHEEQVIREEG